MKPQSILIIRLGALGDILLTTPIITEVKKKFPRSTITFLVKQEFSEAIKGNPLVDKLILLKKHNSFRALYSEVRMGGPYTLLIDLQSSAKTRILSILLRGIQTKVRYKKPYLKRILLVFFKKNFFERPISVTERYFMPLRKLGIYPPFNMRLQFIPQKPGKEISRKIPLKYFAIAPGAKWFTKRWPERYWVQFIHLLIQKYKYHIVICGGKDEKPIAEKIINESTASNKKYISNQTGKLMLSETAWVLGHSNGVISNDSGLMHLASTTNAPTLGLFLSTVKEFGFFPVTPYGAVSTVEKISCRPCNHKGLSHCPRGHFNCAILLTPEKVFEMFCDLCEGKAKSHGIKR